MKLNDGIEIQTRTMGTIRCDARRADGDINIISHAHTDHLPTSVGSEPLISSSLTAALARERRDLNAFPVRPHPDIELLPSGHIEGSRAALINDGGVEILFTGDVAIRSRWGLDGFDPVEADILVMEATYGSPQYEFPPCSAVESALESWLSDQGGPTILHAYALGKAQRVFHMLGRIHDGRIVTPASIARMNELVWEDVSSTPPVETLDSDTVLRNTDVIVASRGTITSPWFQELAADVSPSTAGCSGWALDSGYIYRRNVDAGFPISDHCDFPELVNLVRTVNPDVTYLHHGFSGDLAKELTRLGFDARALRRNQSTLGQF